MLSPNQVIPFLRHEDSKVREQAVHYLDDMGDLAPPETEEQAWLAIERFGGEESQFGSLHSATFLRLLGGLTPTDFTARRAIDMLRGTSKEDEIYWLNDLIRRQSPGFLADHRAEWESLVDSDTAKAIEARLALREAGAEALWQTLVQLDEEIKAAESSRGFTQRAEPVVEALLRFPDIAIANAMDILCDPRERWWLEIWSAEIACTLRHSPAIDLLIKKMRDDDGDFLREQCERGLSRTDPELLVPALESASSASGEDILFRNSVGVVLGNTKHPLAEAALIRLLEKEEDPTPRAFFAMALCELCTTDGLELVRDAVLKRNYDRSVSDLMEMLVTQSKFVGYAPPELPQWIEELAKKATQQKARQRELARMGLGDSPREMMKIMRSVLSKSVDSAQPPASPPPRAVREPSEIIMPIRRSEAKVGRNDPCPCGSGKKYKKCCG